MPLNYLDPAVRKSLIQQIKGDENRQRKAASLKQFEIFHDRQLQYVIEYLRGQFAASTVREIPVVSSINLSRRIVYQEASIYRTKPNREFSETSDDQNKAIDEIYEDMSFDAKMMKANQVYKLQNQACLMIIPKDGKLMMRVMYAHHYDVVPSEDPEIAEAYIISSFDKQNFLSYNIGGNQTQSAQQSGNEYRDNVNQQIGDPDDYKATLERYVVWTKDLNFIMDGNGNILTPIEEIVSPLQSIQMMPFVDIACDKDFEYFVRQGQSLTDFSVQYCGALSDLGNVVKMQGWAQAWMSGSKDLMPENIQIGPNFILKLPIDPDNKVETKFGFSNPSPDLAGSIQYIQMLLSNFLSSRGVDVKSVSSNGDATNFSSGVERLLYEISKFEASKTDMEVFRWAECQCFELIKAWNNVSFGTNLLDAPVNMPDTSDVNVKFAEPQMVQSRAEQIAAIQTEIDLGLKSRVMALMELYEVDEDKALEMAKKIDEQSGVLIGQYNGSQVNPVGGQPDGGPQGTIRGSTDGQRGA